MLRVGLTGNIASGKSTVARLLADRGATVIDADALARRAVDVGTPGYSAIVRRWGSTVVGADGALDRSALRGLVFSDPAALRALEGIVHPEVGRLRAELLAEAHRRGDRIVVCDIPLLFEKNLVDEFDVIILVDAPMAERLARLTRERGLAEEEARQMIAAQRPPDEKRALADVIIENDSTTEVLARRVDAVWATLESEQARASLTPPHGRQ